MVVVWSYFVFIVWKFCEVFLVVELLDVVGRFVFDECEESDVGKFWIWL